MYNVINNKLQAFLIFDNNTYELEGSGSFREVFAPVYELNRKLIYGLLQLYNTPVYIYFQVDPLFYVPASPWLDTTAGIFFIPVNATCYDPDGFVPTKWVQDVFIQPDAGVIYYQPKRMNRGLLMALQDTLGNKVLLKAGVNDQPDGGNVQYFKINEKHFTISGGVSSTARSSTPPVGLPAHGSTFKHIDCSVRVPEGNKRLFFHLDMYLQWIGERQGPKNKKKNVIQALALKAKAFSNQNLTDEELRLIEVLGDQTFGKLRDGVAGLAETTAVPVPMLLFPDNSTDCKTLYAMTYTNAVIENVELTKGIRQITIYFPDFTEEIGELMRGVATNSKSLSDINDVPPVIYTLLNAMAYIITGSDDESVITEDEKELHIALMLELYNEYFSTDPRYGLYVFLRKMHNWLVEQFIPYREIRVCFVRNRFASYAEHYGGLHCLIKPIYG